MTTKKAYLLNFATPQRKKPKFSSRYDFELDQLIVQEGDSWVPAISSTRYALESKKNDIEKGEDYKGP